ncbi:regulator of amino acid metabolism, contains ACT domain protein [Thermococcus sp.]|uniref:regulator of amino acid metabolism, contains ACT domain protein n=1 Tax=Thermococcus sp. TaxID=35749 RepID=UPI0025EA5F27|nr:regulator of amino acid metabolism, contains ACT domain protein [Thermococcus sp.]
MILIEEYFRPYPARKRVAEFLLRNGVSVREGSMGFAGVELSISEVAKAVGVNRKVVYQTVETIGASNALRLLFERAEPELKVEGIAPAMNWEVIEIEVIERPAEVLHRVLGAVLKEGNEAVSVSMRNLPGEEARISIVVEKPLKGETLRALEGIAGIKKVLIKTPEKDKTRLVCTFCEVKYCPKRLEGGDNED